MYIFKKKWTIAIKWCLKFRRTLQHIHIKFTKIHLNRLSDHTLYPSLGHMKKRPKILQGEKSLMQHCTPAFPSALHHHGSENILEKLQVLVARTAGYSMLLEFFLLIKMRGIPSAALITVPALWCQPALAFQVHFKTNLSTHAPLFRLHDSLHMNSLNGQHYWDRSQIHSFQGLPKTAVGTDLIEMGFLLRASKNILKLWCGCCGTGLWIYYKMGSSALQG